jgi:hypothetical protein
MDLGRGLLVVLVAVMYLVVLGVGLLREAGVCRLHLVMAAALRPPLPLLLLLLLPLLLLPMLLLPAPPPLKAVPYLPSQTQGCQALHCALRAQRSASHPGC